MQKKIMAVAVAGALAVPGAAVAQSSTVNLYGVIVQNLMLGYDRGGTSVKHDMQQTTDSAFGFRGEEKLGGDLSAWFQCESTFTLNDGATNNTLCGKNSGVGFRGGFGNAFVGVWDTPMKIAMAPNRPFSTTGAFGVGSLLWGQAASNVGNGVAGGNTSQSASSFTRRQKNLISYFSPNWSGFEFKAALSNANEATAQTGATSASKPRLWGLSGSYTNGPVYIALGYEKHRNFNPAAAANTAASTATLTVSPAVGAPPISTIIVATAASGSSYTGGDDSAWNIGASYTFAGVFKLSGIYSDMRWDTNVGTGTTPASNDMRVKSWGIYGDWAISGPHRLRGGWTQSGDTKGSYGLGLAAPRAVGNFAANGGAGNTGAKQYQLQYAYNFSKRTEVNFGYVKLNNDGSAFHSIQSAGSGITGQDQDSWVVGIRHTF